MGHEELSAGLILAAFASEMIEAAKNWKWFPITTDSEKLNHYVSGFIAFISGLGINMEFDPEHGTLVLSGLFLSSIFHGVGQWVMQKAYYRLAIKTQRGK